MNREYLIIIEEGDDGYLVADVPELPGCHTQGKTEQELLQNVREAIELYVEVRGEPPTRKPLRIKHVTV